ncbi:PEP-CTERM sorting domain-containing protein [Methylomonas albis]|uniref:VPLPA-CTERM sorting domain-containing protein n=1 Tax=Methylomonas albis TaxID=1854563 RepID=A0ABR9CV80_9GAMM|nr:PEP-CTERM sorting domain-containing protein [Methylomonas albis]MBD9354755.1 VPLPA-CTERM sorting domain-containing protein [Methylomonas albis]
MFSKKIYTLILLAAAFDSQAATINFDALQPFNNYDPIPAAYASTADVTVSYSSLNLDGTVAYSDVLLWNAGYADLNTAAFAHTSGLLLSIKLTAVNPSQSVNLSSFDVAAYPTGSVGTTLAATNFRVVDGDDFSNVLVDYAPYAASRFAAQTFSPNLTAHSLNIILGTDWNLGVNNINFNVAAVPLPGAVWLFGTALAGLGLTRKVRKA